MSRKETRGMFWASQLILLPRLEQFYQPQQRIWTPEQVDNSFVGLSGMARHP